MNVKLFIYSQTIAVVFPSVLNCLQTLSGLRQFDLHRLDQDLFLNERHFLVEELADHFFIFLNEVFLLCVFLSLQLESAFPSFEVFIDLPRAPDKNMVALVVQDDVLTCHWHFLETPTVPTPR